MANDPEKNAADEDNKAVAKSKTPLIAIVVGAVGLGGGIAAFAMSKKSPEKSEAPKNAKKSEAHSEDEMEASGDDEHSESAIGPVAKLDTFIANLVSEDGDMRYLKCTVAAELTNEAAAQKIDKVMPRIRNNILLYLSTLKTTDTEGRTNKEKILKEMKSAAVKGAGPGMIRNLLLTEFVIQ